MSWLDGVRHRLRTLFRAGAYERELREEMELHLELDAHAAGGCVGGAAAVRESDGACGGDAADTRGSMRSTC